MASFFNVSEWVKSPIPYAGSKFDMLDELSDVIGTDGTLVDLFTGSGVVGANMADRFDRVLCFDILQDIIAMHENFQKDEPQKIIYNVRGGGLSSRDPEKYKELRDAYNLRAIGAARNGQDPAELGYRFYGLILSCTNNLARFNLSGRFNQTCGKRELSDTKAEEIRRWCEHLRSVSGKITYTAGTCWEILGERGILAKLAKGSTIYVDPPYSNTQAGYNTTWSKSDDERLAAIILYNAPEYRWVVSSCLKDGIYSPFAERLKASGLFQVREIGHTYKASKKTRNQDTRELILWNK